MHKTRTLTLRWAGACGLVLLGACSTTPVANDRPHGVDDYIAGIQKLGQGRKVEAVQSLQSAINANPNITMPRHALGEIFRSDGDYTQAAAQYEKLVEIDPYLSTNHYYLGVCYQILERLQDAAAAYLRALKLNPADLNTNMNLGLTYLALGQPGEAVKYAERATIIEPGNAAAWANYAVALDTIGDRDKAESAYRKSLDIQADQPATMLNFATSLLVRNKAPEAISVLDRLIKTDDTVLARKRYGDALVLMKLLDAAAEQYDAALKIDKNFWPAMNELGTLRILQYKQGMQLDESLRKNALDFWKRSLSLQPNQPRITALVKDWQKGALFKD